MGTLIHSAVPGCLMYWYIPTHERVNKFDPWYFILDLNLFFNNFYYCCDVTSGC
jgi:hypothetical protein